MNPTTSARDCSFQLPVCCSCFKLIDRSLHVARYVLVKFILLVSIYNLVVLLVKIKSILSSCAKFWKFNIRVGFLVRSEWGRVWIWLLWGWTRKFELNNKVNGRWWSIPLLQCFERLTIHGREGLIFSTLLNITDITMKRSPIWKSGR